MSCVRGICDRSLGSMKLRIKLLTAKKFTVWTEPSESIKVLKERITEMVGTFADRHRLICLGV
jgi:hypothetical protein